MKTHKKKNRFYRYWYIRKSRKEVLQLLQMRTKILANILPTDLIVRQ